MLEKIISVFLALMVFAPSIAAGCRCASATATETEVFDHPEGLQEPWKKNPQQKRIAACVTGADGKFCFRRLPSGTYELRISKGAGIDVTSVQVTVDARKGKDKPVNAPLKLGT
jgi:hypothetical protein